MSRFIELSNGVQMPNFGLGTWQSLQGEVEGAVKTALKNGYRLIDTASAYQNEEEIGKVLKEFMSSGEIKREDLFITTKLFNNFNREADVEPQLRQSLGKLGLDYVDLYLIHVPAAFNQEMTTLDHSIKVTDVWKGMEGVYEKKLTRAIGVSNFNAEQIERIQKTAKVPIHNNQVELHLYFNQKGLVEACKKHNISVTAYAPIGSPGRKDVVFPTGISFKFTASPNPLENTSVVRLAEKYKKTPAQILLRHLIQKGFCVIPKSSNEKRVKENSEVFDFILSAEEVDELDNAPQAPRLFAFEFMEGHAEDPFANERSFLRK